MPSPSDKGFRRIDPLSKTAFEEAVAQHDTAIAPVLAALDAEITALVQGDKVPAEGFDHRAEAAVPERIAACLGFKDEIELVEPALAHLRAIGVDFIIVCDAHSTDGTYEVLERHRAEGELAVVQLDARQLDSSLLWERSLAEPVRKAGCDWIVFLDADEFLIPASGSLRDCVNLKSADVLSIDRFNIPLGAAGAMLPASLTPENYSDLLLLIRPIPDFRAYLQTCAEAPWIIGVPVPKPMARTARIAALTQGWHDIAGKGDEPLRRARPDDLLIGHLPFTTLERFARKVENIRNVFAEHEDYFTGDWGWHWRRWLDLAEQGRLAEEFERTIFSDETISALRRQRVICSAAEIFFQRSALRSNRG